MTRREALTVERMDGPTAASAEPAFRRVYAEAFAEPPYRESAADVALSFQRFRALARRPAFCAALARDTEGEPVGIAFGHPLEADTDWWDRLETPVTERMRREDGRRTFGLLELAVRAAWRGRGVAGRLHQSLVTAAPVERVVLNVHPDSDTALRVYRSWGYRKVGEGRPAEGVDLHHVMLLDVR